MYAIAQEKPEREHTDKMTEQTMNSQEKERQKRRVQGREIRQSRGKRQGQIVVIHTRKRWKRVRVRDTANERERADWRQRQSYTDRLDDTQRGGCLSRQTDIPTAHREA